MVEGGVRRLRAGSGQAKSQVSSGSIARGSCLGNLSVEKFGGRLPETRRRGRGRKTRGAAASVTRTIQKKTSENKRRLDGKSVGFRRCEGELPAIAGNNLSFDFAFVRQVLNLRSKFGADAFVAQGGGEFGERHGAFAESGKKTVAQGKVCRASSFLCEESWMNGQYDVYVVPAGIHVDFKHRRAVGNECLDGVGKAGVSAFNEVQLL